MKGIFANRSAWFQLGILTYLFLFGLTLGSTINFAVNFFFGLTAGPAANNTHEPSFYHIHTTQFISDIFIFLLPAVCAAYLCSHTPGKFLYFRKISDLRIFILAALMVFLISPAIDITSYLNQKIQLPEFMSPLEEWMQDTEENLNQITAGLLAEKGIIPFIINIFIIAVMAGLTEEILFRGALLSIIRKKTTNPHLAIWIVAVIFSTIHFQFYDFIPRILSGAFLGYLLYWSKSIWIPVFTHFLNNAIIITGNYMGLSAGTEHDMTSGITDVKTGELMMTATIAIAGFILFIICAGIMKRISPASDD